MSNSYSQSTAFWAITKASFRAIFSNPVAILFSVLFPIIFILIFGAFGRDGVPVQKIALKTGCDTSNAVFDSISSSRYIKIMKFDDSIQLKKELERGKLAGVINIRKIGAADSSAHYLVDLETTSASGNSISLLMQYFETLSLKMDKQLSGHTTSRITVIPEIREVVKYNQIDFILPGQLGFSILFSTLFGIAFTFFMLRQQLVLKRFYASPVNRINIVMGIGLSRLFFQLINVLVLVLFGYFLLNFHLRNGFVTVVEMVLMTILMLILLMGVGLIFSSFAKSDATIPLYINLFGFPQMLLSGTFFSIDVFPQWLQAICKILPLTQYNDAIRKISFEGQHIWECGKQIGILFGWIIVIYIILNKVFKWE